MTSTDPVSTTAEDQASSSSSVICPTCEQDNSAAASGTHLNCPVWPLSRKVSIAAEVQSQDHSPEAAPL